MFMQVLSFVSVYWFQHKTETNKYTELSNKFNDLSSTFNILITQMKHIQRIKEEKDLLKENIDKIDKYYKLRKKFANDKTSLSEEEFQEMFRLESNFEITLPKSFTAFPKTKEATESLLKKLESLESEYQEVLNEGYQEEMQVKMKIMQIETEDRIQKMLDISFELITSAGDDTEPDTEVETIGGLLFKVAKKIIT